MYFTRFGYFVILSIIAAAVAAVVFVVYPFGDDDGGGSATSRTATPTVIADGTAAAPTPSGPPSLTFDQVVNFAEFGAVVDIRVVGNVITVNLRPDFDVSGLNTTSHTFTTTLPPGSNSLEAALQAEGIEVNGPTGVPVLRQ